MLSSNKHNNVEEVIPIDALNEGGTTYNDEEPITLRQRFGRKRTSWFQYIKTKGDSSSLFTIPLASSSHTV
jgi:hypothetical protein